MKKYLLSVAALLLAWPLLSQEADDLGNNYAEVSIIPRLDLNPSWNSTSGFGFDLGNSSLYTLIEGSFSENLSFTVANHWLAAGGWVEDFAPFEMFQGLGYSDTTNWLDYLSVDYSLGSWTFTLGKDCMLTGGHEYDDWDWDVYPVLASPVWNGLSPYQWGGKVAWTTPSEQSTVSLQMTTSPFGEHPFSSGLWTWSAQWSGEYGWASPLWSATVLSREGAGPDYLISLGNQFLFGDWTVTLDWSNCCAVDYDNSCMIKGSTLHGRVDWAASETLGLSFRGNLVNGKGFGNWSNAGLICEYTPSESLRLHALAAYDSLSGVTVGAGILYNLKFRLW